MGIVKNKRGQYKPKDEHLEKLIIFLKKINSLRIKNI